MEKKYCTAVVLAAGKGSRMGGNTAKQYMEIGGKPLVAYALEVFEASPVIDEIILMTDAGHMEYVQTEMDREEGEKESVARDRQDGYVFIHDGARPFVTGEIIERAYRAVCKCNACVVGMPVKDTIKLVNREGMIESSPDRSMVWQAQTPQVFSVPLIVEAFTRQMKEDCTGITDDAMVVEAQMGVKAHMVMGSYANIKITTPEDLFMAEVLRNSII